MTHTTALTVPEAPGPSSRALGLFSSDLAPDAVVNAAAEIATALGKVITDRRLFVEINRKPYVILEGWTLLGSMVGAFASVSWSRPIEPVLAYADGTALTAQGWEARAEVRNTAGALLGAAEAQCTRDESRWSDRPDYQLRSMAQTRAIAKALRLPLGFIVQLAGYESTPAEDIEQPAPAPDDARAPVVLRLVERAKEHGLDMPALDAIAQRLYGNRVGLAHIGQLNNLAQRVARGEFDPEQPAPPAQ